MNLNLGGRTSKLIWSSGIVGSLVFVISAVYLNSPTIEHSLESKEFQLISKQDKKFKIYERIFKRHKHLLISINLDDLMGEKTSISEGSVALGFWCDNNLKRKHFFVDLDGFKRFCALSMGDVLWLEKNKEKPIIEPIEFNKKSENFQNKLFSQFNLDWNGDLDKSYEIWKNQCEWELSKPYSIENKGKREAIGNYCLGEE
ncbi:hypothetical protein HF1_04950 [Mycoplasma haemofelis str. Langford 1]|uniref:Uncharacterized protein n=1 Tax=Mycoplasma haemofelis (strain Langford 1) TaxID=941640 RepID=E8ZH82_MYCHL|nr:hypothetical protein [Mycoplasma haemofelis]CBY92503.1 hypothetical protein HF1_04950 [Mycoplasma haemofelis str. Langford 1]